MKTMKAFAGVVSVALMLVGGAGCKKNDAASQYAKLVDKLCACKDAKCLADVQKEASDWMDKAGKGAKPSDDDMKKIKASMEKASGCASKMAAAAAGGDAPKTP